MEKLDKHIKTKLEERRISPSQGAWDKIIEGLPAQKKSSSIKKYAWGIAASFIGILLVSVLLFEKEQSNLENPIVEKTSTDYVPEKELRVVDTQEAPDMETHGLSESAMDAKPLEESKETIEVLALKGSDVKETLEVSKEILDDRITNKLEEVLAHVVEMEGNAQEVSDREIDSLLMAAQRELLSEKVFQEQDKVDAMALLNEVELELFDDQRNPLFIKLKESFFKLRTSVADRNK
nr:hypothetical protein [Allomuricauda sp.]